MILLGRKPPADAVLDRIVHHALRVELYGESLKRRNVRMKMCICEIFYC